MSTKRALVCAPRMPEYDRERGSQRVFEVIEFLLEAGWDVSFVAKSAVGAERYVRLLQQRGVATYAGFSPQTDRLIAQGKFDLAVCAFWYIAELCLPAIRSLSPATRVIVDSIDLHFLRTARRLFSAAAASGAPGALPDSYAAETIRELNAYAAADGVLAVSGKEADLINDLTGDQTLAHTVPLSEDLPRSPVPFGERRGIFFVGNFRHLPNGEAVEYLCTRILPRLDPAILAEHPVYVVGNAMTDTIRALGTGWPQVQMVGWVPDLRPYFERARISVVPLLHGAGVKGKLIQSLMHGTPAVATGIGIEGLDLRDREHVLVADAPDTFAASMQRLLTDTELWQRLAGAGRAHIAAIHGREAARPGFLGAVAAVLAKAPKRAPSVGTSRSGRGHVTDQGYEALKQRLREAVSRAVPAKAKVVVVSKGDSELLRLPGREGWHFPQTDGGEYAGHYPVDSAAAIVHLEALRARGADYLVFPSTAIWWLDHYAGFNEHLEGRYQVVVREEDTGIIFSLRQPRGNQDRGLDRAAFEPQRPSISGHTPFSNEPGSAPATVLVIGTYRRGSVDRVDDVIAALARATRYQVEQRWAALGAEPPTQRVANVTVAHLPDVTLQEQALDRLLANEELQRFEYVLVTDADVILPAGFTDAFFALQRELQFAVAQPARTGASTLGCPMGEQQLGVIARQTSLIDPTFMFSLHRSTAALVLPFEVAAASEPGREAGWFERLADRETKMGIIDAVVVGPGSMATVDSDTMFEMRAPDRCKVLEVFNAQDGVLQGQAIGAGPSQPRISVVVATYNRSQLLAECLDSLVAQTLAPSEFEVIVIDDGSTDDTRNVCGRFLPALPLKYFRLEHAGRSAAKNLGIFAASAPLLLFFDDDDIADADLLREHLATHAVHPQEAVAVLGYTTWAPKLHVTPAMDFVTGAGGFLFNYQRLKHGQMLDFTHFWEGRVSCKRSFLLTHGVHDQRLAYTIDIELGYRLSKFGLQVVFNPDAKSYMTRPVTFDEFSQRCEGKGRAQFFISRLHPEPAVQEYCEVLRAEERWRDTGPLLEEKVQRVHELESLLVAAREPVERDPLLAELRNLYKWTFSAFKLKGIIGAMRTSRVGQAPPADEGAEELPQLSVIIPAWNVTPELAEMMARNIERVWQVSALDLEVIVIDNGSTHHVPFRSTRTLRYEENRGIAAAWNAGADLARGVALCFLNNDVWVEPGWDTALSEAALDGRRIAFPHTDQGNGLGPQQADTAGLAGWCFVLSRQVWDEIGRFDETFNPAFFEDTDYFHRAWLLGVELSPVPAAAVKHSRRTSARHQPHMDWLFQAHRLKYGWKHGVDPTEAPPFYHREIVPYEPRGRRVPA